MIYQVVYSAFQENIRLGWEVQTRTIAWVVMLESINHLEVPLTVHYAMLESSHLLRVYPHPHNVSLAVQTFFLQLVLRHVQLIALWEHSPAAE